MKICGKEIVDFHSYCSRECYYESRRGLKRPEHGKKVSAALKKRKDNYIDQGRAETIRQAKLRDTPEFFEQDLNAAQRDKKKRDKEKFDFAISQGYIVIELWEMDIYRKIKRIKDALKSILVLGEIDGKQHFSSEFF